MQPIDTAGLERTGLEKALEKGTGRLLSLKLQFSHTPMQDYLLSPNTKLHEDMSAKETRNDLFVTLPGKELKM